LTPQTASSTGSIQTPQTPPRSHKSKNGLGWLPKFSRHVQDDRLSTPLLSGRSTPTGWATPHDQQDGRPDLCYSHDDMANQYFQVTSGSEPWTEGKRKGVDRSDVDQRIMHRLDSAYPLPCDDQEQRVSSVPCNAVINRRTDRCALDQRLDYQVSSHSLYRRAIDN
jgi:hypothetical protein